MILDWRYFALGSAFFAAITAICGKIGVSEIPSNLATFLRTIVILFVTAAFVSWRSEWIVPQNISIRGVSFLVLSGIATGFSWLCYYRALALGPASKVAALDKFSVLFVVIFALLFLGEAFSWKVLAGGILIVLGSALIVL